MNLFVKSQFKKGDIWWVENGEEKFPAMIVNNNTPDGCVLVYPSTSTKLSNAQVQFDPIYNPVTEVEECYNFSKSLKVKPESLTVFKGSFDDASVSNTIAYIPTLDTNPWAPVYKQKGFFIRYPMNKVIINDDNENILYVPYARVDRGCYQAIFRKVDTLPDHLKGKTLNVNIFIDGFNYILIEDIVRYDFSAKQKFIGSLDPSSTQFISGELHYRLMQRQAAGADQEKIANLENKVSTLTKSLESILLSLKDISGEVKNIKAENKLTDIYIPKPSNFKDPIFDTEEPQLFRYSAGDAFKKALAKKEEKQTVKFVETVVKESQPTKDPGHVIDSGKPLDPTPYMREGNFILNKFDSCEIKEDEPDLSEYFDENISKSKYLKGIKTKLDLVNVLATTPADWRTYGLPVGSFYSRAKMLYYAVNWTKAPLGVKVYEDKFEQYAIH